MAANTTKIFIEATTICAHGVVHVVHEQYILLVEQSTWRTSLLLLSSAGRGITFHIPLLEGGEEKVGQIRRVWETA